MDEKNLMWETDALKFTENAAGHWDFVTRENLTAAEAAAFLNNGMQLRSFRENISSFCQEEKIGKRLTEGLYQCEKILYGDPGENRADSIRRKVHNWMNDRSLPTEREELFQICFALGLDEYRADGLLKRLSGQGIHYRNERDLIYAYCLKNGLGYGRARELLREFRGRKKGNQAPTGLVTGVMRERFRKIRSSEDFISFLLRHSDDLGEYHNTAYAYFDRMLELLRGGGSEGEACSVEYVAENYLRMGMPLKKDTAGYSVVQKMIKRHWPGLRSIKAMKNRSEDVDRKTLLLLYIVTGGVWDNDYDELDEAYIGTPEFLEIHCRRINRMLTECGMGKLDPRGPFDYLILYCLRPETDMSMSERMSRIIGEIYGRPEALGG